MKKIIIGLLVVVLLSVQTGCNKNIAPVVMPASEAQPTADAVPPVQAPAPVLSQNSTPPSQTAAASGYLGILIPPQIYRPKNLTESINNRIVQIVFVAHQAEGDNITPIGTGFLLTKDGYIVTANHLIDLGEYYMQQTNSILQSR